MIINVYIWPCVLPIISVSLIQVSLQFHLHLEYTVWTTCGYINMFISPFISKLFKMPQAKHNMGIKQDTRWPAEKGREIPMSITDSGWQCHSPQPVSDRSIPLWKGCNRKNKIFYLYSLICKYCYLYNPMLTNSFFLSFTYTQSLYMAAVTALQWRMTLSCEASCVPFN